MRDLTFAEQVKIVLSRKSMTIKELAQLIERRTGRKMSRQNLTQRLLRDNFQEQDMRMISGILGCPFTLSILGQESAEQSEGEEAAAAALKIREKAPARAAAESSSEAVEMTIGELFDMNEELDKLEEKEEKYRSGGIFLRRDGVEIKPKSESRGADVKGFDPRGTANVKEPQKKGFEPVIRRKDEEENLKLGELNPYTGHEYQSNSVRTHPSRIGYVQVYDRRRHQWTDMTEWAFLGYQDRKKALLGKDYEPPIYLD